MDQPQPKIFNTAGVCVPSEHYMLPVLPRIPDFDDMIKGKFYFILHAPRQSGKTTCLQALTAKINSDGLYYALNCSLASLRGIQDKKEAIDTIADIINKSLKRSSVLALKSLAYPDDAIPQSGPAIKINNFLNYLCVNLDKELVVFFDEADSLSGQPLITFLAQIRDGYLDRHLSAETKFPRTLALVGMRDIRDYLVKIGSKDEIEHLASPYNIKKGSLTLANFQRDEIQTLYHQHTESTGQKFTDEAIDRAWYWTEGQPWLVNALAYEIIVEQLNNNYSNVITNINMDQAAETLIQRRDTHIDSLLERLNEPRVIEVMDSVFAGADSTVPVNSDDRQYCIDLGLVVKDNDHFLRPSNKIYQEVIFRVITDQIHHILPKKFLICKWVDGKVLLMTELLKEFQQFWKHDSESYSLRYKTFAAFKYDEATHVFMLLAFLQRVVNSGGEIHRDVAEGRGRVDIEVIYKDHRYLIEAKIKGREPLKDSIEQLSEYLKRTSEQEGWLVVFDRSLKKSWDEKIYWDTQEYNGITIHVVGC